MIVFLAVAAFTVLSFTTFTSAEGDSTGTKKNYSLLWKKLKELSEELDKVLGEFNNVFSAKSGFDSLIVEIDKQYTGHWNNNDDIPDDIKKPISDILEQAH